VGESAVAVAARERSGRLAANARLKAFRDWYESVRLAYQEGEAGANAGNNR
jgi:hypothetical protein